MAVYLLPWEAKPNGGWRPQGVSQIAGTAWSCIDLRADPTTGTGRCIVGTDGTIDVSGIGNGRLLGAGLDATVSGVILTVLRTALGVTSGELPDTTPRTIIRRLLTFLGREDGTRWRNLTTFRRGRFDVHEAWLNGELVFRDLTPVVSGGAVFTDDFTRADGTTIGNLQPWTEVDGAWSTVLNRVRLDTSAGVDVHGARADSNLSTLNQYCQVEMYAASNAIAAGGGPSVRYSSSAHTCYHAFVGLDSGANHVEIDKIVAGVSTSIGATSTFTATSGTLIRLEAAGATLRAYYGGLLVVQVTDTAITSGVRGGIGGYDAAGGANLTFDNWAAGDLPQTADSPHIEPTLLGRVSYGIQLPLLGPPLFASPRPVTGFSQQTLGSFTSQAWGSAPAPYPNAGQLYKAQALGVQLPVLGPPLLFPRTPVVTGFSQQTLGSVTSSGYGQVAPQNQPRGLLVETGVQLGLNLPVLGPPLFAKPFVPVFGFSQQTLDAFTSSGYGQAASLPPSAHNLIAASGLGVQLPFIGPAFFTSRAAATVSGTIAAVLDAFTAASSGGTGPDGTVAQTLDAFTAALSGNVGRAAQPEPSLFKPGPQGIQLPLIGPAFFAAKLVTGTIAATLGACTSSSSGGTGPDGTVAQTLDGFTSAAIGGYGPVGDLAVTLAGFISAVSGGTGPNGTVAAVLAAFTCIATGTVQAEMAGATPPFLSTAFAVRSHRSTLTAGHASDLVVAHQRSAAFTVRPHDSDLEVS